MMFEMKFMLGYAIVSMAAGGWFIQDGELLIEGWIMLFFSIGLAWHSGRMS